MKSKLTRKRKLIKDNKLEVVENTRTISIIIILKTRITFLPVSLTKRSIEPKAKKKKKKNVKSSSVHFILSNDGIINNYDGGDMDAKLSPAQDCPQQLHEELRSCSGESEDDEAQSRRSQGVMRCTEEECCRIGS